MKVKELIKELKGCDPEAEVIIQKDVKGNYYYINKVFVDKKILEVENVYIESISERKVISLEPEKRIVIKVKLQKVIF